MKIWVSGVFRGKNTQKKQRQSTLTQFVSFCSFHFIFFGGMFFVVRFCQNINHFQFSHECMPRDVLTVWLQSIEVKNWLPFEWVFTSHLYKNDRPMIKKTTNLISSAFWVDEFTPLRSQKKLRGLRGIPWGIPNGKSKFHGSSQHQLWVLGLPG